MFRNSRTESARPRTTARIAATVAAAGLILTALTGVAAAQTTHEVERGDTLAKIARDYDGVDHWRAIYEANDKLDDPNLIFPGQELAVPTGGGSGSGGSSSSSGSESASESEPATSSNAGVWDRLAECESNGNWSINTGNGYYGGLQFALQSWRWVGGSGYPHEASKAEQIKRAEILLDRQGWSAWPACSSKLGLR